ncbi:zinc knuckle CX2CX4HX4C containing protein [Tanacetum coccineum]
MYLSINLKGIGSVSGNARVLVEVNADKVLANHIDVMYRNSVNGEKFMKKVRVEYDWKPPMCSQCKVFGHADNRCPQMVNKNEQNQNIVKDNKESDDDPLCDKLSKEEKEEVEKYVKIKMQRHTRATKHGPPEMRNILYEEIGETIDQRHGENDREER